VPTGHRDPVYMAVVEARMQAGKFSQAGFLAPGERLAQVLADDAAALAELGVSTHALSERLGDLLETAVQSKRRATHSGQFIIRLRQYKGAQICPFAPEPHTSPCPGSGAHLGSIDWVIRNMRNGVRLAGPGLIVHLIGTHGFFEGPRSPYRTPPRALAELLELGPFDARWQ
jgi:hypothetical protein